MSVRTRACGEVGLADVHALHVGAGGTGGQVHIDAVVDQQGRAPGGVPGARGTTCQEFRRRGMSLQRSWTVVIPPATAACTISASGRPAVEAESATR